jgi:predicted glutamine amidotransferase
MCRFIAWVTHEPATVEELFGIDAVTRLAHLSTVHADGWGLAYLDADGAMEVHRSAAAAHADPDFLELATNLRTSAGMIHLRFGTPGYGAGVENVHPFTADGWAFIHNGAIGPGAQMHALRSPGSARSARGATDSERLFLSLLDEIDAGSGVDRAVDASVSRMRENGLSASCLNSVLMSREELHLISWHDPRATTGDVKVWPSDQRDSGVPWPPYLPLDVQSTPSRYLAASSGIIDDPQQRGWSVLPNYVTESFRLTPGHDNSQGGPHEGPDARPVRRTMIEHALALLSDNDRATC